MVAKLVLDEISSSGAGITIDSTKTFTVNGNLLTTGATQVTASALATISIDNTGTPTVNISGKSNSLIAVNATSNSSVVTLPPVANFSTCSISVVSSHAHGAGYKIEIKDNGGTELYTLYNKGDHCEFISDGTNVFRTGNEFATVRSEIALTANVNMTSGTTKDIFNGATASNYSVLENIGSGWNSTTHDFIAPHAGVYRFGGHASFSNSSYMRGWLLKQNTNWLTNEGTGINGDYSGGGNTIEFPISLAAGDSIEFWMQNHSGSHDAVGSATSTDPRCRAACWMMRRD